MITHSPKRWIAIACAFFAPCLFAQDFPVNTESAEARAHFVRGVRALDFNRPDDARPHFDAAIGVDNAFAAAYVWRALSATSGAEWQQAMDGASANRDSATPFTQHMIDAMLAGVAGNSERTMELAQSLVDAYPNHARAHALLAGEYANHKEYLAQRAALTTAMAIAPDFGLAQQQMANSYIFNEPKDYAKAEHYARQMVAATPDESMSYVMLGDALRAQSRLEDARDAYGDAATVNPRHFVAHSKRGHANTFLGQFESARADFAAAAETSASFAGRVGSHNFGVFTHLYAGNVEAGLKANQEVIQSIADSALPAEETTFPMWNTLWQRGQIAMHNDMFDVAAAAFAERETWTERAINQVDQPDWATTQRAFDVLMAGMLAAHRGDLDAARSAADQHHQMLAEQKNDRRYEGYHQLMGIIELKDGNAGDAVAHLAKANDQNPMVMLQRAQAHEAAGNQDQAMVLYRDVVHYNFNSVNTALARSAASKRLETAGP